MNFGEQRNSCVRGRMLSFANNLATAWSGSRPSVLSGAVSRSWHPHRTRRRNAQTRAVVMTRFDQPIEDDALSDGEPIIIDLPPPDQRRKKQRARTSNLVGQIQSHLDVVDPEFVNELPPVELDETAPYARTAVRSADERKAIDPVVLRVSNVSYITTFMVIVTGKNPPQLRAIANNVEENLVKEHELEPIRSAGTANSGWILLDYGDMMVHVFSPDQRASYDMEKLWSAGQPLDVSDCITKTQALNATDDAETKANRTGSPSTGSGGVSADDDDDDWLT